MKAKFLWLLLLLFSVNAFSQKSMTWFVPDSQEFGIYYPKDFILTKEEEHIINFTDPNGALSITVSSYFFKDKDEAGQFITELSDFTGIKRADWANYKSKFDDLFEGRIKKDDTYGAWWSITQDNHAIAISINKESEITGEDINLLRYMIDSLKM